MQALADGRPAYVRALADELTAMREHGGRRQRRSDQRARRAARARRRGSPKQCGFCYELRLHRARGYGALKAILEILAEEEGLTLTEISQRLQRTPGSTKDYLSWLEDVDLVDVAAEALQLHRSAAARLGAPALPRRRRRPKTTSRAKCTATRCRACRRSPSRRRRLADGTDAESSRSVTDESQGVGASSRSTRRETELES